jgi:hypothetical protein
VTYKPDRNQNKAPAPFSIGQRLLSAMNGSGGAATTITPNEAFGYLLATEPSARKLLSQIIMQQLTGNDGEVVTITPEAASRLRPALALRKLDTRNLALTPPDPNALLECVIDPGSSDPVEVRLSARGLAVIEALLSGHDATY